MGAWRYVKGAHYERELQKKFELVGFKIVRAAGSGVAGDTPDLLVLGTTKHFAIEAKAWKNDVYIDKTRFTQMLAWQQSTNMPIYIAWKPHRKEWKFFPLAALRPTEKSFVLAEGDLPSGITFEEIAGII